MTGGETTRAAPDGAIALDGVTFTYEALRMRFDLSVPAGQFVAVIGPSGAGKSTLINLIAGFEAPATGRVVLLGRDRTRDRPADRPVTTLFQEHNLFEHLTVARNVGLGLHPGLRLDRTQWAEVDAALARVGLSGMGPRLPHQLSGGERRRVALARSLVRRRPILLLDEPFSALDPGRRHEMVGLVEALRREQGLTVLLVTHQLEEVAGLADRVLFVADGRVLADATPDVILAAPTDPEIRAYVGRAPERSPSADTPSAGAPSAGTVAASAP